MAHASTDEPSAAIESLASLLTIPVVDFDGLVSRLHDCVARNLAPWETYQEVVVSELASLRAQAGTDMTSTAAIVQVRAGTASFGNCKHSLCCVCPGVGV